jgi:luciferase-like monooxygenase
VDEEPAVFVEVASELETWPGVRVEREAGGTIAVHHRHAQLGTMFPALGVVELPFLGDERDALIEHGDAEAAQATPDSVGVGHALRGPSDVTAVLELFDQRYRDLRGDDEPYASSDPA